MSADMVPLKPISVEEALTKIWQGKHYSLEDHPTRIYRSPSIEIPVPIAIASYRHVTLPAHFYGPARLTNENLFLRDGYKCVYCGKESENGLTRDHVIPSSKGGKDVWENVVTACEPCNLMKGSTLHTTNAMGEFIWEVIDPKSGNAVTLVLRHKPSIPNKITLQHVKAARKKQKMLDS